MKRTTAAAAAALLAFTPAAPAQGAQSWETMTRRVSTDTYFELATVWYYGDSITVATYSPLVKAVYARHGIHTAVDANAGIPTTPAVERLIERLRTTSHRPSRIILALGSNDAVYSPAAVAPALVRAREALGPGVQITFIRMFVKRAKATPTVQAAELANCKTINASIPAGVADITVDWYGFLAQSSWRQSTYLADGVHTTALGTAARNALILSRMGLS